LTCGARSGKEEEGSRAGGEIENVELEDMIALSEPVKELSCKRARCQ